MDAMPRARTANQEQEAARAGRRLGRASVRERASFSFVVLALVCPLSSLPAAYSFICWSECMKISKPHTPLLSWALCVFL